ncbi:hypothetical protein BJV78DRAFT_1299830 [Lactifluus subvellereus]|nr:hypothetical protein BJV78DRAFT_1299830 [Lactifluus subvellereus]
MSDLDFTGTNLLALTLVRALTLELTNTRETCLNHRSSSVLAKELSETETLISDALREINILRSDMRLVNRLPVEILIHIFGFLGAGSFVVPVSHVCRRWRSIALCTPSLWTVIREDDDILTSMCFMERSQNMTLDVSFPIFMREEGFKLFQDAVAPHASRIRRLHVGVYGDRVYDFYRLLAECDFMMPALEHFSIRMSRGGLPQHCLFGESEALTELVFRGALPLQAHFSPSIRSLTLADRVFDLDTMLGCLEAAPNLEYLALLDSVPHTFESTRRSLVALDGLREFHWFQGRVFDNLLGTVKLFEHLVLPRLDTTEFVMLLDPTKYSTSDLYTPCHRSATLFSTVTELNLEATHYAPGKPARNNIVFNGRHNHETVFSVRVNRASLEHLCVPGGIFLTSSVHIDLSQVTQLTFTSMLPYTWGRFFRTSWAQFFRCLPAVKVLRLHVSKPAGILASIIDAEESPYPLLPELRVLHLFRCESGAAGAGGGGGGGGISDEDGVQILLRFLERRADFGMPIESIVCSSEDGSALPPAVLALVDSVEFGRPGKWAEMAFPSRMGALLEEHLN